MTSVRVFAFLMVLVGALALAYGGFSYTKDTTALKMGPMELTVKEKETISVPVWAGFGLVAVGGILLLVGGRKK